MSQSRLLSAYSLAGFAVASCMYIAPIRDSHLAKFIEKHFTYEGNSKMISVINTISQNRSVEKKVEQHEKFWKDFFNEAKITLKDD